MKKERAKFLRIYSDIPDDLRSDIIVVMDGETYTWNAAYLEVKKNSDLGHKILKRLGQLGII